VTCACLLLKRVVKSFLTQQRIARVDFLAPTCSTTAMVRRPEAQWDSIGLVFANSIELWPILPALIFSNSCVRRSMSSELNCFGAFTIAKNRRRPEDWLAFS